MKIRSISDVITNSSSEVFIVRRDKTSKKPSDPMKMISDICLAIGIDPYKKFSWEIAKKNGKAISCISNSKYSQGDLIITKPDGIFVPDSLLNMIQELNYYDNSVKFVERIKY